MTAGDAGAKTAQVSPLRMRSASCFEAPEVRLIVTSRFFSSNAFLSPRIGPASESARNTSTTSAIALVAGRTQITASQITRAARSGGRSPLIIYSSSSCARPNSEWHGGTVDRKEHHALAVGNYGDAVRSGALS